MLMQNSLETSRNKLHAQVDLLSKGFLRHVTSQPKFKMDGIIFRDGLISSLWQVWCFFCRDVIVKSTQGAVTARGSVATSHYSLLADAEIAFVARKIIRNEPINSIRPIGGSHLEPTWGDVSKAPVIVQGIGCTNSVNLIAGLSGTTSLRDLQACRNANAHIGPDTIASVKKIRQRYSDTILRHPSDMALWVDPSVNDFLWMVWSDDMKLASDVAIQ
jgi:hypothetical protein